MFRINSIEVPQTARLLQNGEIGVIPTDTVYGLVCSAFNRSAVKRMYGLKDRTDKPGTLIASNIEQVTDLGIPRRYLTAVKDYWPNPISIIIPTTPDLSYLDLGKMSLAIRIPSDPKLSSLLSMSGPLLTTSANMPGKPPVGMIKDAEDVFGEDIDFYLDGGDLSGRPASTIIRVIDDVVEVLREGAVKINENGEVE